METNSLESLNLVKIIEMADAGLRESKLDEQKMQEAEPYLQALIQRLNLSHQEALALCCVLNLDDYLEITTKVLCRYFACRPIQIMPISKALDALCEKGLLLYRKSHHGSMPFYVVPDLVVEAIQNDHLPEEPKYDNLQPMEWVCALEHVFQSVRDGELSHSRMLAAIHNLINGNQHLQLTQYISNVPLGEDELVLLLITMVLFVCDSDDYVMDHDIDSDMISDSRLMCTLRDIRLQRSVLAGSNLIEFVNRNGQVDMQAWRLTDRAKREWLVELELSLDTNIKVGLTSPDTITEKKLYYSPQVSKQVERLQNLLQQEQFAQVQERLDKNGMRRGFACIFYGAPGTGKTETAQQLAKATGRAIMLVNIPSIRSKWVGDTEKNIKATFDRYRDYCKNMPIAPILLFNEADALLCKRSDESNNSVDKMENAMQNIILQEMETLDGIMIATTNLTTNLDAAFERRFLYKIEFTKPTPQESQHIWHTMLPELSDDDALALAKAYNFSGGQIENVARKQLIHSILEGKDGLDITAIREACNQELLNKKSGNRIGFC